MSAIKHGVRDYYGTKETNGLENGHDYHAIRKGCRTLPWTTPGLRITRLRLLSDPGYPMWDVSYCDGMLGDEPVKVELPFSDLPKRNMMAAIIKYAKDDKVYAKGLGIFGAISTLN